jgi:hypothetical protein
MNKKKFMYGVTYSMLSSSTLNLNNSRSSSNNIYEGFQHKKDIGTNKTKIKIKRLSNKEFNYLIIP